MLELGIGFPAGLTRDSTFQKANLGHVDRQMPCSCIFIDGNLRISGLAGETNEK